MEENVTVETPDTLREKAEAYNAGHRDGYVDGLRDSASRHTPYDGAEYVEDDASGLLVMLIPVAIVALLILWYSVSKPFKPEAAA